MTSYIFGRLFKGLVWIFSNIVTTSIVTVFELVCLLIKEYIKEDVWVFVFIYLHIFAYLILVCFK